MRDVSELKIYQNALKLLKPIYRLANLLPTDERRLRSQLIDAAKSIAPLIAEGFAKKRSQEEFKRFLLMALGSSDEVMAHISTIKIIGFYNVKAATCDCLFSYYKILSKQINRYIARIIFNLKSRRSNDPKSDF